MKHSFGAQRRLWTKWSLVLKFGGAQRLARSAMQFVSSLVVSQATWEYTTLRLHGILLLDVRIGGRSTNERTIARIARFGRLC